MSIKIIRAFKKCKTQIGEIPSARAHIIKNLPETVIAQCSSTALADLVDAMHLHFCDGKKEGACA